MQRQIRRRQPLQMVVQHLGLSDPHPLHLPRAARPAPAGHRHQRPHRHRVLPQPRPHLFGPVTQGGQFIPRIGPVPIPQTPLPHLHPSIPAHRLHHTESRRSHQYMIHIPPRPRHPVKHPPAPGQPLQHIPHPLLALGTPLMPTQHPCGMKPAPHQPGHRHKQAADPCPAAQHLRTPHRPQKKPREPHPPHKGRPGPHPSPLPHRYTGRRRLVCVVCGHAQAVTGKLKLVNRRSVDYA